MNENNIYKYLAIFYNQIVYNQRYVKWKELIKNIISKYSIKNDLCIDIACGTGLMSAILVDLNFKVIGIDQSLEMLNIARTNNLNSIFIEADIRNFNISNAEHANFAVSFHDALNYLLTDEDMIAMFKSLSNNLALNSIFLFDMLPRDSVIVAKTNKVNLFIKNNFYIIYKFTSEDRIWTTDIDIFIKQSENDNVYQLFKERHLQRGYNKEDIISILKYTDFKLIDVIQETELYEDFENKIGRYYYIIQKFK